MGYRITLIPGDGIGPEVTQAARQCIDALGIEIEWEIALAGEPALKEKNFLLPKETLDSIRKNRVALKGPIITPVGSGFRSVNVALRQTLNLFACVRPAKSITGIPSKYKDVDIVVIRENSEDLYAGVEFFKGESSTENLIEELSRLSGKNILKDSAISIKPISQSASERVIEFAFEWAQKEGRKKITCVHKANIMKATDGLFLSCFKGIASKYPNIIAEDVIVDNLCMQLILKPEIFDVLVLPNLYGDIISEICAGLIGGLGVAPGANIGKEFAVFEPVHGAAPKYAGKNKVNPTATILSGVMMLKYLGEIEKAKLLEEATYQVIKEGKFVTYDLKQQGEDPTAVGTKEMAQAIIKKINKMKK
ncbi:MAG: isocitrate/isopropylmalate dehydrogenase family protein [Candidatus Omnitrophota bacterium]|nr:MAG: isocitrate/isopropylmalate dehydrogenase family protein [Candidatus Omnitrophota bacterium]